MLPSTSSYHPNIAVLLVVEIVADKIPTVDHVNDVIQTVVRPAVGGIVAVAASGSASGVTSWLLVLAGVLLAGGVHVVKATARPVVNATTAGVGAPVVSTVEDAGALVLSVLAIVAPILVVLVLAGLGYLSWRLWRRRRARREGVTPS